MEKEFLIGLGYIITIVVGILTIVKFSQDGTKKQVEAIKENGAEERKNAVEIAKIQKDIEAQKTANVVLRQETQAEISHINSDIREIKHNQEKMRETQGAMSNDVRSILTLLEKGK